MSRPLGAFGGTDLWELQGQVWRKELRSRFSLERGCQPQQAFPPLTSAHPHLHLGIYLPPFSDAAFFPDAAFLKRKGVFKPQRKESPGVPGVSYTLCQRVKLQFSPDSDL